MLGAFGCAIVYLCAACDRTSTLQETSASKASESLSAEELEAIWCGLPAHPETWKLAECALYWSPGDLGPGKPTMTQVAFAMWDDGRIRWLPEISPTKNVTEYLEGTLDDAQRERLVGRLAEGFQTLDLPQETSLSFEMHERTAHLV